MKTQAVQQRATSAPIERIKFALRFAGADLSSFRPEDWLNLKDDVNQFLGIAEFSQHAVDTSESASGTNARILKENRGKALDPARLPHAVKGTVRGFTQVALAVDDAHAMLVTPLGRLPSNYELAEWTKLQDDVNKVLRGELIGLSSGGLSTPTLMIGLGFGGRVVVGHGPTSNVFLVLLFLLLARGRAENIAQCPECATMFWRDRRGKMFCSRRCANLASVKAFKARKKAAKLAEQVNVLNRLAEQKQELKARREYQRLLVYQNGAYSRLEEPKRP